MKMSQAQKHNKEICLTMNQTLGNLNRLRTLLSGFPAEDKFSYMQKDIFNMQNSMVDMIIEMNEICGYPPFISDSYERECAMRGW